MATDIKKMLNEYKLAWNSHDVNKILSFFADDCIYEDVANGSRSKGKKELTIYLNSIFVDVPDMKLDVKSIFGAGDWAGTELALSGTNAHNSNPNPTIPATGKTFSIREAAVFQLSKGKIMRQYQYYDQVSILKQVGLIPTQPK